MGYAVRVAGATFYSGDLYGNKQKVFNILADLVGRPERDELVQLNLLGREILHFRFMKNMEKSNDPTLCNERIR